MHVGGGGLACACGGGSSMYMGGGVDLAWRRSFCCAVPVHHAVLQFREVKVNKKILWQNHLRG